jgi:cystathionine beta-lyase/cystathionine gamma-synthase
LDRATLLWLEIPSNPGLDVCDLAVLIEAAHKHGALVAVDNKYDGNCTRSTTSCLWCRLLCLQRQ